VSSCVAWCVCVCRLYHVTNGGATITNVVPASTAGVSVAVGVTLDSYGSE
jgi:hypothetical protein